MSAPPDGARQVNGEAQDAPSSTDVQAPIAASETPPASPAPPAKAGVQGTRLYFASVLPGLDMPLPAKFSPLAKAVLDFEDANGCAALVLIQSDLGQREMDSISDDLASRVLAAGKEFETGNRLSLILHTGGGDAHAAYRIATFLQKQSQEFEVVIPRMAKSAGTLISLAASRIIMGQMAELGPLDMQVRDMETEMWDSALNETKSLQTLSREALVLYTEKMELLKKVHTWKTFETRNRIATEFVNEMIRPLVQKIDAVHYTRMARIMEIMKKYGRELMGRAGYQAARINKVVQALSDDFPDHSYIIDTREAKELGLKAESARPQLSPLVEAMAPVCGDLTIIGRISAQDGN
jgi:ATP-dependent protease ClpP protease subunit